MPPSLLACNSLGHARAGHTQQTKSSRAANWQVVAPWIFTGDKTRLDEAGMGGPRVNQVADGMGRGGTQVGTPQTLGLGQLLSSTDIYQCGLPVHL